jgi:hypothetical protein
MNVPHLHVEYTFAIMVLHVGIPFGYGVRFIWYGVTRLRHR